MFAPRAAGPCWFRNSWDGRRDKAVVGRSRACDKSCSRISQGGGGGLRDSVCGRAGKGEGEGGWVTMMGRPGAPATKRNNAPNKSMAGFPFGCFVLEVGHMTVVEQAGGRHSAATRLGRANRGSCERTASRCPLDVPSTTTCNTLPARWMPSPHRSNCGRRRKRGPSLQAREVPSISYLCLSFKPSLPGLLSRGTIKSERFCWIVMQHQASSPNAVKCGGKGRYRHTKRSDFRVSLSFSSCPPSPSPNTLCSRVRTTSDTFGPLAANRTDSTTTSRPVK